MNPFANIMAAVMRGAAEVQGQEEAKREADKQAAGVAKSSVTLNPDSTVTIKNIDPTMLNTEDRGTNLQKAYETPKINVEKSLRERGFVPDDPRKFADPSSIDSFGERYAARQKLRGGGFDPFGAIQSAIMAGVSGGRRDADLRKNRANQVAAENSATFQNYVKPVMDEEQDEAQLGASVANTREIATKRRSDLIAKTAAFSPGSTEDDVLGSVVQQLGGFAAGEEEQARRAFRTSRVSFLDQRRRELSGEQGKNAIASYAEDEFPKFLEEQVGARLGQMNEGETAQFYRTFRGLQEHKAKLEAETQRKLRKDQRDEDLLRLREENAARISEGQMNATQALARERGIDNFYKMADMYDTRMKPYSDIEKQAAKVEALAEQKTGEADYAIILTFVSSIDNSVARESEVATARSTVDLASQAKLLLAKWREGDLLDDKLRQRFVNTTRALRKSLEPEKQKTLSALRSRAEATGVSFDKLTGQSSTVETYIDKDGKIRVKR